MKVLMRDLEEVLENAISAGLYKIIITSTSVDETNRAIKCTELNPSLLFTTAGVHPHNAKDTSS